MSNFIKILFIGDVVGESGLKALEQYLPLFMEKYTPNAVIVNGENSAGGRGITEEEANFLFRCGTNVITSGNHVWENWKSRPLLSSNPNILRPFNYPSGNPGRGYTIYTIDENRKIAILNLQGRTFMQTIDCPFKAADYVLAAIVEKTKVIVVDFHADATAEKISMGWFLDGRVSAVIGTHTHVQTSDASILTKGTAFITDVGMTGPFDSVVGMKKDIAIKRFTMQTPFKYATADSDLKISGVYLKIDYMTGKAIEIESFIYPPFNKNFEIME